MKIATFLFLLLFCFGVQSQSIRGKLVDAETDSVVAFASVYFNAAYKGTSSDIKGNFELNINEYQGQAVVFSCVGYESAILEKLKNDPEGLVNTLNPQANLKREPK